jgi:hypothetical protein
MGRFDDEGAEMGVELKFVLFTGIIKRKKLD